MRIKIAITKNAIASPAVILVSTTSAPLSFELANRLELCPVKALTIPSDFPLCNKHTIIRANTTKLRISKTPPGKPSFQLRSNIPSIPSTANTARRIPTSPSPAIIPEQ